MDKVLLSLLLPRITSLLPPPPSLANTWRRRSFQMWVAPSPLPFYIVNCNFKGMLRKRSKVTASSTLKQHFSMLFKPRINSASLPPPRPSVTALSCTLCLRCASLDHCRSRIRGSDTYTTHGETKDQCVHCSSNVTNPFSLSPHAPRPHTYAPYVAFYTFDVFFFFFFFLGMLFPTDSGPTLAEEEAEAEEG